MNPRRGIVLDANMRCLHAFDEAALTALLLGIEDAVAERTLSGGPSA